MANPLLSAEDLFTLHVTALNMTEYIHKAKNFNFSDVLPEQRLMACPVVRS